MWLDVSIKPLIKTAPGPVKIHADFSILWFLANFNTTEFRKNSYVNPFGLGIEIKTFGHVFLLNFVNSRGIGEGQFLPYTKSKWSKGEFRFGFTIARKFNT